MFFFILLCFFGCSFPNYKNYMMGSNCSKKETDNPYNPKNKLTLKNLKIDSSYNYYEKSDKSFEILNERYNSTSFSPFVDETKKSDYKRKLIFKNNLFEKKDDSTGKSSLDEKTEFGFRVGIFFKSDTNFNNKKNSSDGIEINCTFFCP